MIVSTHVSAKFQDISSYNSRPAHSRTWPIPTIEAPRALIGELYRCHERAVSQYRTPPLYTMLVYSIVQRPKLPIDPYCLPDLDQGLGVSDACEKVRPGGSPVHAGRCRPRKISFVRFSDTQPRAIHT
jgi:hypothetical protein